MYKEKIVDKFRCYCRHLETDVKYATAQRKQIICPICKSPVKIRKTDITNYN